MRTTVYLPEDLKRRLSEAAAADGTSEASFIRTALERVIRERHGPRPNLGIFAFGDPTFAERVDEHLEGFGET